MKDLNDPITYLSRVLVPQKSVGLADKGTVHITGEELRPRLKDEEKKQFTSKTSL